MTDPDDTNQSEADTPRDIHPNHHQQWWEQNIEPLLTIIGETHWPSQKQAQMQALVGTQGEALLREEELAECKISSVTKLGTDLRLDFFEEDRRIKYIPLEKSGPYLNHWLSEHPLSEYPNAPLWISLSTGNRLGRKEIGDRFVQVGNASGFGDGLTPFRIRADGVANMREQPRHSNDVSADDSKKEGHESK